MNTFGTKAEFRPNLTFLWGRKEAGKSSEMGTYQVNLVPELAQFRLANPNPNPIHNNNKPTPSRNLKKID